MARSTSLLYPEEGGSSAIVPSCVAPGETAEDPIDVARDAIPGDVASLRDLSEGGPEEEESPLVATIDVPVPPASAFAK